MRTHHHHHPGKRGLAVGLALCALACATVTQASAATRNATPPRPSGVQIVRVSTHGFDWGDAGIGAAAGIGISMLAVGAALLIGGTRRNRQPPPRLPAKEQT